MSQDFVSTIIQHNLQEAQYMRTNAEPKVQIYLHHTASGPNASYVIDDWEQTPSRIGTAFVIAGTPPNDKSYKDGSIYQAFGSKYWAYHLGLTPKHLQAGGPLAKTNEFLNKYSIGIELCSWGPLTKVGDVYFNYVKRQVPNDQVVEYEQPYRTYKYYQKYSVAQLESLRKLLLYLTNKYNITRTYHGDAIFDVLPAALQGTNGIFTHTSVRPDKFDCHPQPELIAMLKSLSTGE